MSWNNTHSQTSTVQPFKFGNELVISSHNSQDKKLIINERNV